MLGGLGGFEGVKQPEPGKAPEDLESQKKYDGRKIKKTKREKMKIDPLKVTTNASTEKITKESPSSQISENEKPVIIHLKPKKTKRVTNPRTNRSGVLPIPKRIEMHEKSPPTPLASPRGPMGGAEHFLDFPRQSSEMIIEKMRHDLDQLKMEGNFTEAESLIDDYMMSVQTALLHDNIGEAISILEKFGPISKGGKLSEEDICRGFDIQDNSFAAGIGKWKGILTVQQFNENITYAENEESDSISKSLGSISMYALTSENSRGFLFFKQADQTFHPLRKKGEDVEIYDRESGSWKKCTEKDIADLSLQPNDLCIGLGKPLSALEGAGIFYENETRTSKRDKEEHFYNEAQGVDSSLCAIHAANAFCGYHAVDISDFYLFARKHIVKQLHVNFENLYSTKNDYTDVRLGTDPSILLAYIKKLVANKKLPLEYASLAIHEVKKNKKWADKELSEIPVDKDRILFSFGGSHFAALRKAENGKWYLVDSMDKNAQKEGYDTPQSALKNITRQSDTISIIY